MFRSMRRLATITALVTALAVTATSSAFAWSNGPSAGNGYGTHDWILDQALKVLDGRADGWFDAQAARLTTDDPDTVEVAADPSRKEEHVYRESGKRGGAVDRVAELYGDAVAHYDAGDYHAASEDIGLLAHFYGDILNPYHSAYAGIAPESHHKWYEGIVGELTRTPNDQPGWSSASRSVSEIGDIRASVIDAAAYSRKYFARIHASMKANHSNLDASAKEATGSIFKFGAKGLANIIYSVSRGAGLAPPAARLTTTVKWTGVAKGEPFQAAYVTAKDAAGRPIEGLAVEVQRPTPSGILVTQTAYTDTAGRAKTWWSVGATSLYTKRSVTVTARTGSATKTANTWYMVSPTLASGRAGFKSWMSDTKVKAGQLARVKSIARDRKGRPVAGLKVTWTWRIGSKTVVTTAITNSRGRASSTYLVTTKTTRSRITIAATTQSASHNRNSSAWFRRN